MFDVKLLRFKHILDNVLQCLKKSLSELGMSIILHCLEVWKHL